MRAVNLIPADAKRGGGRAGLAGRLPGPGALVIAALAIAVLFVTIYVLTGNTIAERTARWPRCGLRPTRPSRRPRGSRRTAVRAAGPDARGDGAGDRRDPLRLARRPGRPLTDCPRQHLADAVAGRARSERGRLLGRR